MADNVNITAGAGTIVAADDIGGGVLAQRIKLVLGPDGTGNDALAGAGVNGTGVARVTIATDQGTITTQLPATIGNAAKAASLGVALATDDLLVAVTGAQADAAAVADNSTASLVALTKRNNQNITTMSAKLPAALGTLADAASISSAFTTEGKAQLGSLTETAPASDTASSGLNGRFQRACQRLTSLIALFPTILGVTTKAGSLSVALASDDNLVTLVTAPATGTQTSVASSATDVTILASNASSKGRYVYNDSTQALDLLCSNATSSATLKTVRLAAGDSFAISAGGYTGVIKGIWVSANGFARVTEFT